MEIITIPINNIIYRGTDLYKEKKYDNYIANWYTFNIAYAQTYCIKKKEGVIKAFKIIKPLKLIDIGKTKLKDLSNTKDIRIGTKNISLRFLFSVLFGYGIEKNNIKFFKGNNLNNEKYKGTQIYEFYQLTKELDRGERKLSWIKKIKNNIPKDMVKDKFKFNRISDGTLDKIFLYELSRYKKLDGYYAPKLATNWTLTDCEDLKKITTKFSDSKCKFIHYEELAIFNNDKIKLIKSIT